MSVSSHITIRTATRSDENSLRLLAELDSQPRIVGDALIAEVCGRAVAALESGSGRTVADPFQPTAAVVELLQVRSHGARRRSRGRHLRLIPRAA
jgi:hypothetical protein